VSALPPGWVETTLGEVCEIVGGSTPKTGTDEYWGGDVAWLTPDDLSRHEGKVIAEGSRSLTRAGYESCSTRLMPPGSVLFTSRAPIGYVAIAARPICTNQGFKSFIVPEGLVPDYLYWYLHYATPTIRRMGSGTTFQEVSKKVVAGAPLLLPPTNEQRRIVEAIEEQFSRLDVAEESLARGSVRLSRLRDLVVDSALAGEWQWTTVGEVAEVQGGIQKQPKRRPRENAYPFLRVANVHRSELDLADVHEIELFDGEIERYRLAVGDLLVVEGNGSIEQIGRSALWKDEIPDCVHQNHLIRVRPGSNILPSFLNAYWNAASTARRLASVASSTSGLYTLSTGKLKSLPVPVPPPSEQRRIVREVERQLSLVDALGAAIDAALRRSGSLRRAILDQAFRGTLVPHGPSNEPASVLLERVAAGRPAGAAERRGRASPKAS